MLKPKLHGVMVSVGSSYAVAQLEGMPLLSGIFAIIIKHLVNMHYLFGIGGLELCWKYIGHQFLKNSRKYNFFLQSVLSHARGKKFPLLAGAFKNLPGLQVAAVRFGQD